ncbi:MAG: hypothetical protein AB7N76_12680 [Planctomycetota bacterium]
MSKNLSERLKAEHDWWASLSPDEKQMAAQEDAVRDLRSKLKLTWVKPARTPTPEELRASRDAVFEFFVGRHVKHALAIQFGRSAEPGEFLAESDLTGCVICGLPVARGTMFRRYSGWVMHPECVKEGLELGERLDKKVAFAEKYERLLEIRGKSDAAQSSGN